MFAASEQRTKCFSCKGLVPDIDGPTHSYMLSSPGCWHVYGEILAKEYAPENYDQHVHHTTTNTYAVQHPGEPERRSIQSVNAHLLWLYVVLENGLRGEAAQGFLKEAVEDKEFQTQFSWLEPPSFDGTLTVADVIQAEGPEEHAELVQEWSASVWKVWKDKHYATIANLVEKRAAARERRIR